MHCIYTGCDVYLTEYNILARGDAYTDQHKTLFLRIVNASIHTNLDIQLLTTDTYIINAIDMWWDRNEKISTLISHDWDQITGMGLVR